MRRPRRHLPIAVSSRIALLAVASVALGIPARAHAHQAIAGHDASESLAVARAFATGAVVRIMRAEDTVLKRRFEGRLLSHDSLTIEMRWRDVAALEVSRRRPRPAGARAWSGAKWGMLVGGVTGAAIGAAVGSDGAQWTSVADSRIGRVAPR